MSTEAYCTLLYNDSYLPGALVLGHALRESDTDKDLAVLVGPDVSPKALSRLSNVYDKIIPTTTISTSSNDDGKFQLLNRPNLDRSYTKINVWKLVQYSKIVFMDADTLPIKNIDELFDHKITPLTLETPIAGAPDIGWPDIFNSGVVVLKPNNDTFAALAGRARAGLSFDGGDQGLLNQFFENRWHRLPFTFNVTPSASYQYIPAYRHFKDNVAVFHYIGQTKPWSNSLTGPSQSSSEFEFKWWNVFNKYYDGNLNLKSLPDWAKDGDSALVQSVYKVRNNSSQLLSSTFEPDVMRWDATKFLPPLDSKPEASNLEVTHYTNIWDNSAQDDPAYIQYSGYMKSHLHYNPRLNHQKNVEPPHQPLHHSGHKCHHDDCNHDNHSEGELVQPHHSVFPWENNNHNTERVFPEDYGYLETKPEYGYQSNKSADNSTEAGQDTVHRDENNNGTTPGLDNRPSQPTRVFRDYSINPSNDSEAFEGGFQIRQRNTWDMDRGIKKYVTKTTKTQKQLEMQKARQLAIRKYESSIKADNQVDYKPDETDKESEKQDKQIEEYIKEEVDEVKKNPMIHKRIMEENQDGVILKRKTRRGWQEEEADRENAPMYLPITPNPVRLREAGRVGGISEDEGESDYNDGKLSGRSGGQSEEVWDPNKKLDELGQLAAILKEKCQIEEE